MRSPWYLVVNVIMMLVAGYFVIAVLSPMMDMFQEMSDSTGFHDNIAKQQTSWLLPSVVAGIIISIVLFITGILNIQRKAKPLWQSVIGLSISIVSIAVWFMWLLIAPKFNLMYIEMH